MSKITRTQLKQYLKQRSYDELMDDLLDLFSRLDAVKDYYRLRLSNEPDVDLLNAYKSRIRDEFFPARGYGKARLSIARKPITEYRNISNSPVGLIDLMLYYVEMGVQFTTAYGDIDEAFYASMEGMYDRAAKLIAKEGLADPFQERCQNVVDATSHMGWGFHDTLLEIYAETFSD
jgi:hypothetical protein